MIDAGAASPHSGAPSVELPASRVGAVTTVRRRARSGERAANGAIPVRRYRLGHMERGVSRYDERSTRWQPFVLIGATSVALLVLVTSPWHLTDWLLTHWTFRYGDGLRGRALLGSLLGWSTDDPVAPRTVVLVAGTLIVAFTAACVWLIVKAWGRQPTLVTAVAATCLLTAPGGLPLVALDVGRFDVVGLLFVMVSLAVVLRWRPGASLALVAVLGAVGVAVHEAVLVAQLPLMLAAWWVATRPVPRQGATMVAAAVLPAAGVMAWIAAGATLSPTQADTALLRVSGYISGDFSPEPLSMATHARDTGDAMTYTWSQVGNLRSLLHRAVGLAACAPALLVGWHLLRRFGRDGSLLVAASFGPLALFLVGHDWGRWLALITINVLVAGLWLCAVRQRPPLVTVERGTRLALGAAAVVSVLLPSVDPTAGLSAEWYWDLVSRL